MRSLALWLLPFACVSATLAQEVTAGKLMRLREAQTSGSLEWFESGFELVEAQLHSDVAAALQTAEELAKAARGTTYPDISSVVHVLHWLALAARQGPLIAPLAPMPASTTGSRPTMHLSATASASTRARYFTARARRAYYADTPTEFLPDMFTALEAARESGNPLLLHRAVWTLHLVLERAAAAYDTELLSQLAPTADDPAVAQLAAWHALQLHWRANSGLTRAERLQELAAIDRTARDLGDLRTQVHTAWDRVALEMAGGDKAKAAALLVEIQPLVDRLGDRRLRGITLELAAEIALDRDLSDDAAAFLASAAKVTKRRGLPDRDIQQAHLDLQLATRRGDTTAIATATKQLDGLRREEERRYLGFHSLLEQLLTGERQHLELERNLAKERDVAARTLRTVQIVGLALLAASLLLLTVLTLRSRRRLQKAHHALQKEARRRELEVEARLTLEQRLRQLERSESLGVVAGGVAHDFNNLMLAVLGNADLLSEGEHDPERQRLLDAICAAGESGARVCSQLQAYAGNQTVPAETFNMATVVRSMAPVLEAAAGPSMQLTVGIDSEQLSLQGRVTDVELSLLNLVTNARDAKASTARVAVSLRQMTTTDWQQGHVRGEPSNGPFACLEVADNGEGMDDALMERIFDPFFTTRFPGRGLGLAVVFGAVRRHHGAVTITSESGHGTRFRLYLPMQPQHGAAPVESVPEPTERQPIEAMTVLVVDDETHIRDLVRRSLERRGHRVLDIGDGRDLASVLPSLAASPRAIALVDLTMPGMDGRDVVRQLQQLHDRLPVVLMSGHAEDHLSETARELQVSGHVSKPFRSAELENALDAALSSSSSSSNRRF